jgi:hypothetical protein
MNRTGGKLIAVWSQYISGVNPLVAFYDIHGRKREVLFFYIVPDTTRNYVKTTFGIFLWRCLLPLLGIKREWYVCTDNSMTG